MWSVAIAQTDPNPGMLSDEAYLEYYEVIMDDAEDSSPTIQYDIGLGYLYGRGLIQDASKAFHWFALAAEQGLPKAQHALARMYWSGTGTTQDHEKYIKWLKLAADNGHPVAMNQLAAAYAEGMGVPQDYVVAHMWANLATARGETSGLRDALFEGMTDEQIAEAQRMAREWKQAK